MASEPFAIWITGLPASGKSSIVRSLAAQLAARGVQPVVLESDELRRILTPHPTYDPAEREQFYNAMISMGALLMRQRARREIPNFIEVYVECPLEICMARDPKGIYRRGRQSPGTVPGLHEPYEEPGDPEVVVHSAREDPEAAAARIVRILNDRGFVE